MPFFVQRRDGSNVRSKIIMLEKAIRDLEKFVAESTPPNPELQDGDNSSQAIKRRLPPEIKQKLVKVARYAQASHGKLSRVNKSFNEYCWPLGIAPDIKEKFEDHD